MLFGVALPESVPECPPVPKLIPLSLAGGAGAGFLPAGLGLGLFAGGAGGPGFVRDASAAARGC